MTNSMRQKLGELKDLRQQNYITEEEYAAARANIFLDAGFDIAPRIDPDSRFVYAAPPREEREKKSGCGCFFVLFLLLILLLGGIFAMPDDLLKGVPALERFFEHEQVQAVRHTLLQFVDDLTGKSETPELSVPTSDDAKRVPSVLAAPDPNSAQAGPEGKSQPAETPDDGKGLSSPSSADASVPENEGEFPEPPAPSATGSIEGSSVRLRSSPEIPSSGEDNVVGRARRGEALTILEEATNEDGERWYRVRMDHGDREGWLRADLVRPAQKDSE